MAKDLSILLGLHDPDILELTKVSAEFDGFKVYAASTMKEMRILMRDKQYCGYLMDLNLGYGGIDISPAREIYTLVRRYVERNEAFFLGISGRDDVVKMALQEHIPAEGKPFHMFPFLQRCHEIGTK